MASREDVRSIALGLPGTVATSDLDFAVGGKGYAWAWRERIDPRKARVPNLDVLAVRVPNELEKQSLLSLDPGVFFTEPHYNGYPAVLIRIPAISRDLLADVLTDAWRTRAPKQLLKQAGGDG